MQGKELLRLAISLDDKAPSTIDKYICRIVEEILLDSESNKMTVQDIYESIESRFGLQFDMEEIEYALKRRGRNAIILTNGVYSLTPQRRNSLSKQVNANVLLLKYVQEYCQEYKCMKPPEEIAKLLNNYLYHCFNSNIGNLLALFEGETQDSMRAFQATNEEIDMLNDFIAWDNDEKNKYLYAIISFSYEYCMLTTKKDAMLSQKIFQGKRFLLDSNLIFRMAGINKDERKYVTNNFVEKCREVGIDLCYTSETLSEIYRVIDSQVKYICHLAHYQEPIDPSIIDELIDNGDANDFYELFDHWSRQPGNKYDDYTSFQRYLLRLVKDVISNLTYLDVTRFSVTNSKAALNEKSEGLLSYKRGKRGNRRITTSSAKTDIINILYTLSLRLQGHKQTLWETNVFIVSADQLLIGWSRSEFEGVPIVVIPSVWLTIILRFTGRSSDDYRSFSLFLGLRHHFEASDESPINPVWLLSILARKTVDKEVKEAVIHEIIQNDGNYSFESHKTYDESVEKAFDKVVTTLKVANSEKFAALRDESDLRLKEQSDESAREQQRVAQFKEDETITQIATQRAQKKIDFACNISFMRYVLWGTAIFIWLLCVAAFLYNIQPIAALLKAVMPSPFKTMSQQWDFIKWIGVGIGVIFVFLGELIKNLASEDRRKRLITRYYKEGKEAMEQTGRSQ